ncbi:MAG TPA: hypothetical protein VHW00_01120 [Thermoanaerobaculia bacterium]|nr:hypothetical protein [Thermoanaerobaculia bacterium]
MRWLYADPNVPQERQYVQQTVANIDAWWREFVAKNGDIDALIHQKSRWDLPGWMQQWLQAIHPNLMWEFGGAVRGKGHRLVITPEASRWLRPLVSTLLERAPSIEGWEFYPHRLAEIVDDALRTVQARVGVDMTGATVEVIPREQRVHLRYTFDACRSEEDEDAVHAAFVATESLLGEAVLDQWVGAIEVAPVPKRFFGFGRKKPDEAMSLDELAATVASCIEAFHSMRPDAPCIDRDDDWTMWELKPAGADDYPRQSDLFVGKSMFTALWMATRGPTAFFSDSFSRHGETFCYLKIDGSEGVDAESFEDKGEIEDALDSPLRDARAGCFIGGGTGLRYSYIDLALLDVDRGIEILREVLRAGNITRRAWLQFYDSAFDAEWVGVWPDSPPPPMPERD